MYFSFDFKCSFTWPEDGETQPYTQNNVDPFSNIHTLKTEVTCITTPSLLLKPDQ